MPQKKIRTAKQMHAAIKRIITARSLEAAASSYDAGVCIRAVGTARDVFSKVAIEGTAIKYCQSVLAALEPVYDTYNDSEGEYTSGKASIGSVFHDIMELVEV